MSAEGWILVVVSACTAVVVGWWLGRTANTRQSAEGARVEAELGRLAHGQDELRRELRLGSESSRTDLARATEGLRGELGVARGTLAELRVLEQARLHRAEEASASLARLERVVVGSASRGGAGENILSQALRQIPPDLLAVNAPFGSRVVEFALRLPGGRLLPIDSKWGAADLLDRIEDARDGAERRRLIEEVERSVRGRLREMVRYLDPERTIGLAVVAVPDAVHDLVGGLVGPAWRDGIVVLPYSAALAQILVIYRLCVYLGLSAEGEVPLRLVHRAAESLERIVDEVEGRLSRSLVQLTNARDAIRGHLSEAVGAVGTLRTDSSASRPVTGPTHEARGLVADAAAD